MDNSYKAIILFTALLFFTISCVNKSCEDCDFYSKPPKESDLSRLPIVEPFELKTAYCCSDWHIGKFSSIWSPFNLNLDVDSIGYENRTIYLSGKNQKYYVLNLLDSSKIEFSSAEDFYLTQSIKLFEVEYAFRYYQDKGLPPWISKK